MLVEEMSLGAEPGLLLLVCYWSFYIFPQKKMQMLLHVTEICLFLVILDFSPFARPYFLLALELYT